MSLWSCSEEDILHGLRERGLPVDSLDDLTAKERSLLHQHADPDSDSPTGLPARNVVASPHKPYQQSVIIVIKC